MSEHSKPIPGTHAGQKVRPETAKRNDKSETRMSTALGKSRPSRAASPLAGLRKTQSQGRDTTLARQPCFRQGWPFICASRG